MQTGGKLGLLVRGTILQYNFDGTVDVGVDRNSGTNPRQVFTVPMPLAFSGPNGEFIGGIPEKGCSVILSQAQGEWFISSYITSNNIFSNTAVGGLGGLNTNLMSDLKPGRILLQTKNASSKFIMDPKDGISMGSSTQTNHIDPKRGIISHNLNKEMSFTAGHRSITGTIKRDLKENSTRNITSSILDSHEYDDTLFTIGMDPSTNTSTISTSTIARNLPLIESHEIVYEFQNFSNGIGFTTDDDEGIRYISKEPPSKPSEILRTESRTNTFNLNLNNPNHIMESIKGTGIDLYGNVLDINRNILPIGKTDEFSLNKNSNSKNAFSKIRALHRKALVYHWEINTRKRTGEDDVAQAPDPTSNKDYARDRSRFFIDIDKEGLFKINVPASSETGNIPLLTRYENASTLLAAQGDITNPNAFIRESENKDVFLESHANFGVIKLSSGGGNLDGYAAPIDRFSDQPIKLGTAYHDITKTILQHQNTGRDNLINYFTRDQTYLNRIDYVPKVVSGVINVSGKDANAGGRSGSVNLDGSLALSIGANTVDRQSLWLDTAGGIVSNIGRDKFGNSICSTLDGDLRVQIGSTGVIGDSRFNSENSAHRAGTLDLRVVDGSGQLAIIRIEKNGIFITTPGRMEFNSEQDMVFRSNSNIMFEGKNVIAYPDNGQARTIKRSGVKEI
jgi:hypothetical protein